MLRTIPEARREFHPAIPTDQAFYRLVRENILPVGVYVKIGRRILINTERLKAWLDAGGAALPGGWRREPSETVAA